MADSASEPGYRWRLVGLWVILGGVRWLAALPITEPRIFQDELLHWHMARAYALHQPFLLFGHPIDSPAVLYPAFLSLVFHVADGRVAFDLARALNAGLVSAVVFPAYGMAREFGKPGVALAAATLAGLVPGGVFSALIMEESLYYPLFVLSCWLCFRVLARGTGKDAAACSVALCLTYFAKPLVVPLVLAYAIAVVGWAALDLRGRESLRGRVGALAVRMAPLIAFGAALLARHLLAAPEAAPRSATEVLLSRFYAEESRGPLVPPLLPLAKVVVALLAALALGTGVTPVASFLGLSRPVLRDHVRVTFLGFAGLVVGLYLLAIARHTLVINNVPRPHERYLFPIAPLLFTAFLTELSPPVRRVAIGLVLATIVLTTWPLGPVMLTNVRTIDAPSLTMPWLVQRAFGSGLPVSALIGSLALLVAVGAARCGSRPWAKVAWLATLPLLLNVAWYRDLYSQVYLKLTSRVVHRLGERLGPNQRITVVVQDGSEALQRLTLYLKFWLADRVTGYWAGDGPPPWYTDVGGPAQSAVSGTGASYIVAARGAEALCPLGRNVPGVDPGPRLPVIVLEVPSTGCGVEPAEPEETLQPRSGP